MNFAVKSLVAAAAMVAGAANAAVAFENGSEADIYTGNNPFTYEQVTNNFDLTSTSTLTSLTYNAFTAADTVPVTGATVNFYADNNGSLGALLYSGNLGIASHQATGTMGGYTLVDYTIDLPSVTLGAGEYFLGLEVSPTQWDQHWSVTSNYYGNVGSDGWAHYFRLETGGASPAPEADTLAMMALGLCVVGAAARRRKARQA